MAFLHAKFHPRRCNESPLRGEKPQNRPLSKLNTRRFALRAMLPVTNSVKALKEVVVLRTGFNPTRFTSPTYNNTTYN